MHCISRRNEFFSDCDREHLLFPFILFNTRKELKYTYFGDPTE